MKCVIPVIHADFGGIMIKKTSMSPMMQMQSMFQNNLDMNLGYAYVQKTMCNS